MNTKIVYLTGFMASGKSTVGPILANTVGWNFFDLDREIEKKEGKKIKVIFDEKGEKYFRNQETEILKELSGKKRVIVALGGGTLLNTENRIIVKNNGLLIYLKCSPETAFKRLKNKQDRPILLLDINEEMNDESLKKKIEKLMSERIRYYATADYCFDAENYNIGVTVDSIARLIQKRN